MPQKNEERLQKYLAECGVASRRKSEELIAAGKVKVNGHVAQIGDKIDPRRDLVTVRGKKVRKAQRNYYILLHKPRGYVTTVSDEQGRKTVMDLLTGVHTRIYPVGRLDRDSEGLLTVSRFFCLLLPVFRLFVFSLLSVILCVLLLCRFLRIVLSGFFRFCHIILRNRNDRLLLRVKQPLCYFLVRK